MNHTTRDITVTRELASHAGSCNACNVYPYPYKYVYVITLHAIEIRLCRQCKNTTLVKLKLVERG